MSTTEAVPDGADKINAAQVRHVAKLARLALSDAELETMRAQLSRILGYVAALDALDVADVPPTSHAVPLDAALRADIVRDSLPRSELLAAAPATEAGAFAVPKVLEGDA
jgi:aspartyl-tRNA(Asn)/glutamyl-tRNA(Gln) amidotransferase subunit C